MSYSLENKKKTYIVYSIVCMICLSEQWESDDVIKLSVAFSQDQDKKQYVQDLIYRDRMDIWRLMDQVRGVYFCTFHCVVL